LKEVENIMSEVNIKSSNSNSNPFLTKKADDLWKRLDKNSNPVSKDELIKRVNDLKNKKGNRS
jgi:hypothetical protein